jgi:ABC-2 type transport system permease protein
VSSSVARPGIVPPLAFSGARPYFALFAARFRTLLQYRAAAWAGVVTQVVFGLLFIAIRGVFYRNSQSIPPLPYDQMVTYTWLGQALFAMTPFTANLDPDVRVMMRNGHVAYELARPLDLYSLWFARQVANRLAPTVLRCGPIFLLGMLFFGMQPPPSAAAFGAWVVATLGALLLVAAFATLITISLLWTISGDGMARLAPSVVAVLSGQMLPLPLFPSAFQPWLRALPFSGMVDSPYRLWTGHLPPGDLLGVVLHQAVWILIFVALGRALLARGMRRIVVQGG